MYLSYRYKLERYITCIKLWKKNYYCCKFESRKNKLHILQKLIKKRIISIEFIFILFLQNSNTHNFIWKLLLLKVIFLRIILYRMFIQIETRFVEDGEKNWIEGSFSFYHATRQCTLTEQQGVQTYRMHYTSHVSVFSDVTVSSWSHQSKWIIKIIEYFVERISMNYFIIYQKTIDF